MIQAAVLLWCIVVSLTCTCCNFYQLIHQLKDLNIFYLPWLKGWGNFFLLACHETIFPSLQDMKQSFLHCVVPSNLTSLRGKNQFFRCEVRSNLFFIARHEAIFTSLRGSKQSHIIARHESVLTSLRGTKQSSLHCVARINPYVIARYEAIYSSLRHQAISISNHH